MESLKTKLEYTVSKVATEQISVIVVAAGSATRMGGINKQTLELCDIPVIARTLTAFENSPYISKIILVTKADDVFVMQNICNRYGIKKVTDIAEGGKNRHESVLYGIARLSKEDDRVLIHDGARPFVNDIMIYDCIMALKSNTGCLCAVTVSDTVKAANGDRTVKKTVDRSNLYLAQTPQGVKVKEYLEVSEKSDGTEFTDDASVLESAGYSVAIVPGDKRNIKITTPDDVKIAESFIERGIV